MTKGNRRELIERAIVLMRDRVEYDEEKIRDPVVEMTGVDTELKEDIKAYQLAISILEKEAGK